MSTLTTHYNWVQPTLGGDPTTWGSELNTDLGLIDAQVWANQQAGVPVGSITMFAGGTPPTNWMLCDGSSLSTTTYATLFAVISYYFGGSGSNFNLPNLQGAFPLGANNTYAFGMAGGEASHVLVTGELPAHAHQVEQTPHTHGVSDPQHTHTVGDPGHTHGINDPTHVHTGVLRPTGSNTHGQAGTADSAVTSTDPAATGITVAPALTGVIVAYATTGITVGGNYANINGNKTDNAGGGGAHNNMPPYLGVNFIIRYV